MSPLGPNHEHYTKVLAAKLDEGLAELAEELSGLSESLKDQNIKIVLLESKMDRIEEQLDQARLQGAGQKNEKDNVRRELEALRKQKNLHQQKITSLQSSIDSLVEQLNATAERVSDPIVVDSSNDNSTMADWFKMAGVSKKEWGIWIGQSIFFLVVLSFTLFDGCTSDKTNEFFNDFLDRQVQEAVDIAPETGN